MKTLQSRYSGMVRTVIVLVLLAPSCLFGQIIVPGTVYNGDTMPIVRLKTVHIVSKRLFKGKRDEQRWTRLKRDVLKVYPYAEKARLIFNEMNNNLVSIGEKKEQRKYVDTYEEKLKEEFEDDLMDLTVRQGKILVKLLDRQTGNTCHQLVKELKGSFVAFFWQNVGRLFGYDLKAQYDPEEERDIEIIIRAIEYSHSGS